MTCPKCGGIIDVEEDELDEGEPLSCDECGAALKVTSLHPLELEPADEDEDDDEEEEEFDEDEEDEDEFDEEEDDDDDEWS